MGLTIASPADILALLNLYRPFVWPLLSRTDPEAIHERILALLEGVEGSVVGRALLRAVAGGALASPVPRRPVEVFGLTFPNVLGVAAGFDKDTRVARGLAALGFGHVEVGTLTPRPQTGNPKPRVFRLPADRALINRMGFPNGGVEAALPRLAALAALPRRDFVVGVSLGKQKETPLAGADRDYAAGMRAVYPHADYLAINVSSPNTPGLRRLQGGRYLEKLLTDLVEEGHRLAAEHAVSPRPLLVKIAPDLTSVELDEILEAVTASGVAGVIATNTTLARDGLTDPRRDEAGGLSGRPLEARATEVIAAIHRRTAGRLPVVGVGGIADPDGARAKLDAGASLLQLYTALVYEGPGVAGRILRGLASETSAPGAA